jgi:hypothetical protein
MLRFTVNTDGLLIEELRDSGIEEFIVGVGRYLILKSLNLQFLNGFQPVRMGKMSFSSGIKDDYRPRINQRHHAK